MNKNEIYIALAFTSLLLIPVIWKHELSYIKSLISNQNPLEVEIPEFQQKPFSPDTTVKCYLGKRKPIAMVGQKSLVGTLNFRLMSTLH